MGRLLAGVAHEVRNPHLDLVETHTAEKALVHELVLADGNEGTVWKRLDAPYEPGKRVRHWLKRKWGIEVEAVVSGFKLGTAGRGNAHLVGAVEFSVTEPGGNSRSIAWVSNWTDDERRRMFGDGVCGRIKQELLTQFNLHTVVRLPNGVFAPYTSIPTNVLFFDRSGPTADVWYYELPPPEGRKQYTKTQPVPFEAFADCLAWWHDRKKGERSWKVPASELLAVGCNLDPKNPNAKADAEHLPPEQLVESILAKEAKIVAIVSEIKALLAGGS